MTTGGGASPRAAGRHPVQQPAVEQRATLKAAGIDGVQFNFYDFAPDFDHFAQTTLPLLKQAGLRL